MIHFHMSDSVTVFDHQKTALAAWVLPEVLITYTSRFQINDRYGSLFDDGHLKLELLP